MPFWSACEGACCLYEACLPEVSYAVVLGGGIGEVMLMLQECQGLSTVPSDSPVQFCKLHAGRDVAIKGTDRRVVTLREVLFGAGSPALSSSGWLQRLAETSFV